MIERLTRMLRILPPSPNIEDLDGSPELEVRVEMVIEKIDSLQARLEALEQDKDASPHDAA
jgi:hypothetical protein